MKVAGYMLHTCLALLPGIIALTWFQGPGVILNVLVAAVTAIGFEVLALRLRRQPLTRLQDGSALLTGLLLGICVPASLPLWMLVVGSLFAIIFAKHLYGGLGNNIFNPAMVGYAVMIISFPLSMSMWPGDGELTDSATLLQTKLLTTAVDGFSGATPLDSFRLRGAMTVDEYWAGADGTFAAWQWTSLAFLAGGAYLLWRRIISWHLPVAFLGMLGLLAALFYDGGSSGSAGSPLLHLLAGGTMLGAFFIITDPVTSPDNRRAQLAWGAGIALITFVIRTHGAYPDGIAFAVLLMNAVTPIINHLTYRGANHASAR